eukprot:m.12067 g.12067  ORF g.12067 m.12067 type:complete len:134 (+) comp23784_c0_seq3:451-852(+)
MTTAAPGGQRSGRTVPEDKINLRLILATGSRAEFLFSPADSAQTVTKHVHENWPKDWLTEARAEVYTHLKLIYLGRFLHNKVTLEGLRLSQGKTTTMHLVVRESIPGEGRTSSSISREKAQGAEQGSHCCTIL